MREKGKERKNKTNDPGGSRNAPPGLRRDGVSIRWEHQRPRTRRCKKLSSGPYRGEDPS